MNALNFGFDENEIIKNAIERKYSEPGSSLPEIGSAADLVHIERSSLARGLDWVGRFSPITRTCAGIVRVIASVGIGFFAGPSYLYCKASGWSDRANDAKYVLGRAYDEFSRGKSESISLLIESNFHDSRWETTVSPFANGKYAHCPKNHSHLIVYSNDHIATDSEEVPPPVGLSRQPSNESVEYPPGDSPEGTPHYPSPRGAPGASVHLFSRGGSPNHNAIEIEPEGTPMNGAISFDRVLEMPPPLDLERSIQE